jgi:chemotaxis protein histidine kinase CheA
MDEVLAEFIAESNQYIETLERDLVALQKSPSDKELLENIFRAMHTIKAGCGFAELPGLEAVAHDSETILMRIRDGQEKATPENLSFVMHSVVLIKTIVQALESEQHQEKIQQRPVSDAWRIIPAAVHDLEHRLNKKITLQTVGGELQINSNLIGTLKNILIHLVRNAADHGIQQSGTISIAADREGSHIVLEVADDGKGLSADAIKKEAVIRNLAKESDFISMKDEDIYAYIFQPGFSTAQEINVFSGRGVGLDSVQIAIEKAGGSIKVESLHNKGCRFTIKIPENLPSGLAVPGMKATIP